MPADLYLINTKTDKRFKIVEHNADKGTVTLEGEYGRFEEKFDKAWLVANNYVLKQVERDAQS